MILVFCQTKKLKLLNFQFVNQNGECKQATETLLKQNDKVVKKQVHKSPQKPTRSPRNLWQALSREFQSFVKGFNQSQDNRMPTFYKLVNILLIAKLFSPYVDGHCQQYSTLTSSQLSNRQGFFLKNVYFENPCFWRH